MFQRGGISVLPEVIKNLLIINALFFVASLISLATSNGATNLNSILGLYNPASPHFQPYQIVSHMFMHSNVDFTHLFFNMFSLWMFGTNLENFWGGKRFLIYYIATGIGAGLLYALFNYINAQFFIAPDLINNYGLSSAELSRLVEEGSNGNNYIQPLRSYLASFNMPMVGA